MRSPYRENQPPSELPAQENFEECKSALVALDRKITDAARQLSWSDHDPQRLRAGMDLGEGVIVRSAEVSLLNRSYIFSIAGSEGSICTYDVRHLDRNKICCTRPEGVFCLRNDYGWAVKNRVALTINDGPIHAETNRGVKIPLSAGQDSNGKELTRYGQMGELRLFVLKDITRGLTPDHPRYKEYHTQVAQAEKPSQLRALWAKYHQHDRLAGSSRHSSPRDLPPHPDLSDEIEYTTIPYTVLEKVSAAMLEAAERLDRALAAHLNKAKLK